VRPDDTDIVRRVRGAGTGDPGGVPGRARVRDRGTHRLDGVDVMVPCRGGPA